MSLTADGAVSPVDERQFRAVMGGACQQVTVVSGRLTDGRAHGTTVTAFCSLSLRPPMVSVALDRNSDLLNCLLASRRLAVSLLSADQGDVAMEFAVKSADKGESKAWTTAADGMPVVAGASGWLSCEAVEFVPAGDHIVIHALVTAATTSDRKPLVYSHGQFGTNSTLRFE